MRVNEHSESVAPDGVIQIRRNPRLILLALDSRNSESTKALLTVTLVGGISVTAYEPRSPYKAQGVSYDLPEEIQDAEPTLFLKAVAPVFQARRLGISEVVNLTFNVSVAPGYVTVVFTRFRVFPYPENPWKSRPYCRFGHISSNRQGNVPERTRDAAAPSVHGEASFPPIFWATSSSTENQATSKRFSPRRPSGEFQLRKTDQRQWRRERISSAEYRCCDSH